MEKNYAIDPKRVYGIADNQDDPEAPGSVWIPIVSSDREECDGMEARTDVIRYVAAKKGGGQGASIDRTHGPFPDSGQTAPVGPSGMGRIMGQDEYLAQLAKTKFNESKGEAQRFVAFHRVRLADFI